MTAQKIDPGVFKSPASEDLSSQEQSQVTEPASMEDSYERSTEPGALIGSNKDLLTEILIRLPSAAILRFKSVSKHWFWLLSDRHFTLRFDNLSKCSGLFVRNRYVPFDVENRIPISFRRLGYYCDGIKHVLDFYPDPHGIEVIQSCNGLLLCCSNRGDKRNFNRNYYVFNPTTRQFAIIPSLPGVRKPICFMGLAFHQTECAHYKVVCVHESGASCQIQIYSSDTGKWKISAESFFAYVPLLLKVVYWNGAIHWLEPYIHKHFYFQVEAERLLRLPFPVELRPYERTEYFGESRGHLHLIVINCQEHDILHMNVYELLGDRSGWFVKYQVDLDELSDALPEMISFDVIDLVRGEKEEDTFMVLRIRHNKIITYNVHHKQISHTGNRIYDQFLTGHRYIESLTSFNHMQKNNN